MTDPDQFLRRRLSAYSRQVADDVRPPGTHEVYRTVKHRQQRRTAVITVACIAVVVVLLGTVVSMRRHESVPVTTPPSASPSVLAPTSPAPSSASPSPSPSGSPSPTPRATSKSPSKPPASPPAPGPARRTFPVVDGSELHVVSLDRVTLRPAGDHYEGTVYVDVYNSGRVPEAYNNVYLTVPGGVQQRSSGPLDIGGCTIPDPPETWICNGNALPAMGGYARTAFAVTVAIVPGTSTQTITGFAVRFVARDQQNTVLTDVTPADNKAVVTLVLPPA